MATTRGRADPALTETLFEEGYRFDFFQAVRVLERLYPERRPVGYGALPAEEMVRFTTRIALSFPPSSICEVTPPDGTDKPAEMNVAFMGLAGLIGVLPRHYTEMILERMRQKDFTLRDFLDLFNHRFISLFYRAWEKYRFPIAYERAVAGGDRYDPVSLNIFHLFGMGPRGLRERLDVPGETLLYYSGLIAQQPHSAMALEALLGDYFEVSVKTQQFVGQWLPLAVDQRARLTAQGNRQSLKAGAVLGACFWDQQAKFRLRLGPMKFGKFKNFFPNGQALKQLVQLVRLFNGQQLDFDLQLVLEAAEVPGCRLGRPGSDAVQLGWSTWLKTKEFSYHPDDAVIGSHWTRI
jgi:type VI secretion system protein ImpH